ncbi:MAG: hypothetical protein LBD87_02420 [Prevotellaceae bacterium]|jgi:hypothetical protein|nr:hypothetical protein [Prevotellaceae bacterium]
MKKVFYILTLALALSSCTEELKKADYDYMLNPANLPGVTIEVNGVTGSSANFSGTVTFGSGVSFIEKGFIFSKTADFAASSSVAADAVTFKASVKDLDDDTRYYAKGYVLTKDGIACSNPIEFVTPFIPPQWEALEGVWTVTEDFNTGNAWYNGKTYEITVTGVTGDKRKIKIEGFAPYEYDKGHTIYATVNNMKLTLPSQELLPGWGEPDFKTYFAAVKDGTLANNAGIAFPETDITADSNGALEIKLLGGLSAYSYQIYNNKTAGGAFAGAYGYARNTRWVKQ